MRIYASGPLSPRESIDLDQAKSRILEVLNHRFLPYWSASPVVSLRSAMIENSDGCYRIQLISINSSVSIIFEYSFVNS